MIWKRKKPNESTPGVMPRKFLRVLDSQRMTLVAANAEGQNTISLEGNGWGYNMGLVYELTPATRAARARPSCTMAS